MRKLVIGVGVITVALGVLVAPSAAAAAPAGSVGTLAAVTIPAKVIPPAGRYIPPRVGGDAEFDGNGPDVFAQAFLHGVGTNRLSVQIFMDAIETIQDFTHARGFSPEYLIYVAPPGQCVRSVNLGTFEQIQYRDRNTDPDNFSGQVTGSFVQEWSLLGDTNGNEAGTRTGAALVTFDLIADVQPC
jgi:hypothetical protein